MMRGAAMMGVAMAAVAVAMPRAALDKPNFIMFFVDDLGCEFSQGTFHAFRRATARWSRADTLWDGKYLTIDFCFTLYILNLC